jgi:hypothetical protein
LVIDVESNVKEHAPEVAEISRRAVLPEHSLNRAA